jgi:ABC-type nitrate/sulfonate/bicarbonate transport system substrate-binding protein
MMQQRCDLFISTVLIYFLLVFSAANAAGTRLVIAYSSINPNSSQLEIARAQGFYYKHGLEPEIILVRSKPQA